MQAQASSGDAEYVVLDDRKKRRMISNRESARRSRMRKQNHLESLISQVTNLHSENDEMVKKIESATELYVGVASENNVLRAQLMELTSRLQTLNSVLEIVEEVSGETIEIPRVPESLLEPWLNCPAMPIMASANMFHF